MDAVLQFRTIIFDYFSVQILKLLKKYLYRHDFLYNMIIFEEYLPEIRYTMLFEHVSRVIFTVFD